MALHPGCTPSALAVQGRLRITLAAVAVLQEVQWDVEAIHNALGFGGEQQTRKLQQDTVGVRGPLLLLALPCL